MYNFKKSKNLDRILLKLSKKDKDLFEQVIKKIEEVINSHNINHYKNLRHDLKDYKRVQVGSFVLVFKYNEKENLIYFIDFDHHDKIYKKKG
jgi:YafQ family addiction module toxin component